MPLPKKLDCAQVLKIVSEFFSGVSVKELASHFKVSRVTITRLIDRKTYKDFAALNAMVNAIGTADYLKKIDDQMFANKHRGRGNTRNVS